MKNTTCFNAKNGQPLHTYFSEGEALDGADYVKKKYGARQEPYLCERCGYWHLSPKERQTPSKMCFYCVGSDKTPKELYETRDAALNRARIIERERGVTLDIYKCPCQNGYHLTQHKNDGGRRPARGKKRG
jgi:hypothetical protein